MQTGSGLADPGGRIFDPFDPALIEDPYPTYARMRAEVPVLHVPEYDTWVVTRYDDVQRVLKEPTLFSSALGMSQDFAGVAEPGPGMGYRFGAPQVRILIATDPPDHQVFRKAVAGAFSPASLEAVRHRMTAVARERVAALLERRDGGVADFYAEVAGQVPVLVLADLLGAPAEMHDEFRQWCSIMTADLDQAAGAEHGVGRAMNMFRFFKQQLHGRGIGERTSLFDSIAGARDNGVSERELLAFCAFLLAAGIETTSNFLTNMLSVLVRHPDVQRRLRERPELLDDVIEEGLRYDPSVQALWRGTTGAVELGGQLIPEGARVMVAFGSANRDAARFPDPDRFLPDRAPQGHVAFGAGVHRCLGARLARMEIAETLRALLAATTDITGGGPATRNPSVILRGFTAQPVRLSAG